MTKSFKQKVKLCVFIAMSGFIVCPEITNKILSGEINLMEVFREDVEEYTDEETRAIDDWLLQLAKIDVEQFRKSHRV